MYSNFSLQKNKCLSSILFGCFFFIFILLSPGNRAQAIAGQMSMTTLYAGRGDCILLESQGQYMLVDSGINTETENIVSYLKSTGLTKIDYVISTHPDGDHVGGFASIFDTFEIGEVFYSPRSKDIQSYYTFMEAVRNEGCPYSCPSYLQSFSLGDAIVTCLYDGTQGSSYNESSLVFKVTCDNKSILLTGDLPTTMERALMAQGVDFKCDVLKVAHHGAALSSCADFLDACSPSIAVISSDRSTTSTLPKPSVLKRLARRFIQTYQTADDNIILNFINGEITTTAVENNPYVSLKNATIALSQNVFTCDDEEQLPSVTVFCEGQFVPAQEYTVEYSGNINTGIGSVKVIGTEVKYVSQCSTDFYILPKQEKIVSGKVKRSNSIQLSWSEQIHSSGYTLQYSTDKKFKKNTITKRFDSSQTKELFEKLNYNTKYYFRVRAYTNEVGIGKWSKTFSIKTKDVPTLKVIDFTKGKIKSLKKPKHSSSVTSSKKSKTTKELRLSWKPDKNCDGYFIQYSTDKTFKKGVKTVRVKDGETSTYNKKWNTKKTYYFRIRPYKMGVTKHDWGKVKKIH